jgi:hypothetical protein
MSLPPFRLLLPVLLAGCASAGTDTRIPDAPLPIGRVQGSGDRSPLLGEDVRVEGVVTADLRAGLGGVFVQDSGDGDPRTSDAVFVLVEGTGGEFSPGTRLRVAGRVLELESGREGGSLTALAPRSTEARGRGTVPAQALSGPPQAWEALEGMRVRIAAPLTVSGTENLDRFGELTASFGGRLWQPSEVAAPGSDAFARVVADNARRRLVIDDGSAQRDPGSVPYLTTAPRAGSVIESVEGVVDQRNGSYRLQVTTPLRLQAAERPPAPQVAGAVRVAVFNLENLFNGDGRGGGFPTARGAESPQQLAVQTARLVATIQALDPDIAALMELENDSYGPDSSLAQFVEALNVGGGRWRFVDAGRGPGGDGIRVGLAYRADRVSPVGRAATLEGGPFGTRSRVPLAQAFRRGDSDGDPVVVVANHFKSKGCSEASGADADQHDGQACWNALRVDSARRLDAWMRTDPTGTGSALQLLVGDFNAYAMEDPMGALRDAGWIDAFAQAGVEQPYSYVYAGLSGRLDHALLSPALAARLRGAAEWHSNADEPDSQGYARDAAQAGPWRSSDHDPMLLGFDL